MIKIVGVEKNSISDSLGIKKGDSLVSFNNKTVEDAMDFVYYESKQKLKMDILSADGVVTRYVLRKDALEDLGLEIEDSFCTKECKNNCIFCFINQLPKGMRKTLYVKDDDFRLSFSNGNYVTLTNADKKDISRIIKQKISPIYVSVHATEPRIRGSMLGTGNKMKIVNVLKKLSKSVVVHAQIVLVPHFNDGVILEKTLTDILPYVRSVAVVPVGLTKHREKLPKLEMVSDKLANETINIIEKFQDKCLKKYGTRKVFASDEMFLKAKRELPQYNEYEDFAQIEDGVGMIRKFQNEFYEAFNMLKPRIKKQTISIATGVSAYDFISSLAKTIQNKYNNIEIQVYAIDNNFFGKTITVTGLIVGRDLIEQLKNKNLGDRLLLSENMFKDGESKFLDDVTISEVEKVLKVKVVKTKNTGTDFVCDIFGLENKE